MLNAVLWIMLAFLFIFVVRVALFSYSVWHKLLYLNLITTKVLIIIVVFAVVQETTYLLDIALIYSLAGFISTVFITLFLHERMKARKKGQKPVGAGEDAESKEGNK